jgi:hypothetical protein
MLASSDLQSDVPTSATMMSYARRAAVTMAATPRSVATALVQQTHTTSATGNISRTATLLSLNSTHLHTMCPTALKCQTAPRGDNVMHPAMALCPESTHSSHGSTYVLLIPTTTKQLGRTGHPYATRLAADDLASARRAKAPAQLVCRWHLQHALTRCEPAQSQRQHMTHYAAKRRSLQACIYKMEVLHMAHPSPHNHDTPCHPSTGALSPMPPIQRNSYALLAPHKQHAALQNMH